MTRITGLFRAAILMMPLSLVAQASLAANLVETAAGTGKLDTFIQALRAAGLAEELEGEGPFTIFAPSNAAFEALGQGTLDQMDQEQLRTVLRDHKVHVVRRVEDVIDVVAEGQTEYGYMWGPLAAWMLKDREDVKLVEGFAPEESWHFALAVREDDEALRQALDSAIEAVIESGAAGTILGAYGLSWQDPIEVSPLMAD